MRSTWRGAALAMLLAGLGMRPADAQDVAGARDAPARVWVAAGLGGGGGAEDVGGAALLVQAVYQNDPHQLSARFLALADPFGSTDGAAEIGLLYGRTLTGYMGHLALSAGVAFTHVEPCSEDGDCGTLGVPVVAEASLRLFPVAGLGAQLFANINDRAVYGGVAVYLQLGWLPRY